MQTSIVKGIYKVISVSVWSCYLHTEGRCVLEQLAILWGPEIK